MSNADETRMTIIMHPDLKLLFQRIALERSVTLSLVVREVLEEWLGGADIPSTVRIPLSLKNRCRAKTS